MFEDSFSDHESLYALRDLDNVCAYIGSINSPSADFSSIINNLKQELWKVVNDEKIMLTINSICQSAINQIDLPRTGQPNHEVQMVRSCFEDVKKLTLHDLHEDPASFAKEVSLLISNVHLNIEKLNLGEDNVKLLLAVDIINNALINLLCSERK